MRLFISSLAILLTSSVVFAQLQTPTIPPRLVQQKRQSKRQAPAKRKAVQVRKKTTKRIIRKKVVPVKTVKPTAPVVPAAPVEQKQMSLIQSHFQIRYFSELIWTDLTNHNGNTKYPGANKNGNYSGGSDPVNLWNQLSFRWKISDKLHAYINPRWTLQLGSTKQIRADNRDAAAKGNKTSDDGMLRSEDWLVGVQGVLWSTKSGWSYFMRPGYRLPISRATRSANWDGIAEYFQSFDWSQGVWGAGIWNLNRWFVANENNNNERYRIYVAPYVTYQINDTFKVEVYYENEFQHNAAAGRSINNTKGSLLFNKRTLQTMTAGVSFPINPSLSLYPFLRFYQMGTYDPETIGYGMWIMGAIY